MNKQEQSDFDDGYRDGMRYHMDCDYSAIDNYQNRSAAYKRGFDQAGEDS